MAFSETIPHTVHHFRRASLTGQMTLASSAAAVAPVSAAPSTHDSIRSHAHFFQALVHTIAPSLYRAESALHGRKINGAMNDDDAADEATPWSKYAKHASKEHRDQRKHELKEAKRKKLQPQGSATAKGPKQPVDEEVGQSSESLQQQQQEEEDHQSVVFSRPAADIFELKARLKAKIDWLHKKRNQAKELGNANEVPLGHAEGDDDSGSGGERDAVQNKKRNKDNGKNGKKQNNKNQQKSSRDEDHKVLKKRSREESETSQSREEEREDSHKKKKSRTANSLSPTAGGLAKSPSQDSFDLAFSKTDFSAGYTPLALEKKVTLQDKKRLLKKAQHFEDKLKSMKDERLMQQHELEQAAKRASGDKDYNSVRMLKKQIKKSERTSTGSSKAAGHPKQHRAGFEGRS